MHARSAIVVASLALALGGCSLNKANTTTPNATGAAKAVATTVSDFSSDASSINASALCTSILASSLVAHLNAIGGCTTIMHNQLDTVEDFTLTVTKIQVSGDSATVRVKSNYNGKDRLYKLALVKQKGGWRISGLSPA